MKTSEETLKLTKEYRIETLKKVPGVSDACKYFDLMLDCAIKDNRRFIYITPEHKYHGEQFILNMENRHDFLELVELYGYNVTWGYVPSFGGDAFTIKW
jgi:hypothetical protein